jgi:hypothetical protein
MDPSLPLGISEQNPMSAMSAMTRDHGHLFFTPK